MFIHKILSGTEKEKRKKKVAQVQVRSKGKIVYAEIKIEIGAD